LTAGNRALGKGAPSRCCYAQQVLLTHPTLECRKGAIILYLEVITDIFQLLVYLVFFGLIITYYSLPLHIIRNVYLTLRSLKQCVDSLMRYRKATTNMNER
jgi:hypothetical protein